MKKLLSLYFHALPLAAHLHFLKQVSTRLAAAGEALKDAVAALLPAFNTALAKEKEVEQWVEKSQLTRKIAEANTGVDNLLVGINAVVASGLHSVMSAIKESAIKMHDLLKSYGNVVRESYDEKAGDVEGLLEQFAGDYAQDVANLGLAMWVQQLQTALNTFVALLNQRADERVQKPPYTAKEVRREAETAYHNIEYTINSGAVMSAKPADFTAFIDHLNPEIERINEEFHRALKDLSQPGCTLIAPIGTQEYTGNPVTPLSDVYYTPPVDDDEDEDDKDKKKSKPTERLYLGRDYEITYKNNINVGQAQLIVHGKGEYKGQKSIAFYIARQPFPVESGELKVEN